MPSFLTAKNLLAAKESVPARLAQLGSMLSRNEGTVDRLVARLRRPIDIRWYRRQGKLRELAALSSSTASLTAATRGRRVLVVSLRSWVQHSGVEATIAQALKLRGASVAVLTCGGGQPICEVGWARKMLPRPCDRCATFTDELAQGTRMEHYRLADEFPWGTRADLAPRDPVRLQSDIDPYSAGDTSAAWFVRSKEAINAPEGPDAIRDYAVSAAAVEAAASRVLERFEPDVVFALNGLFTAEHVLRALCESRGIRFTSYEAGPEEGRYIFSHDRPAAEFDATELWEEARHVPLDEAQEAAIDRLLEERAENVDYFDSQVDERGSVRENLGLPPGRRIVTAFSNLAWDTAVLGRDLAYESMFDWLASTVEAMTRNPDATLIVRVHPAEQRWGTRQPVGDELLARVGKLPTNVRLVGPADPLSSYTIMAMSDLVLTYTTTVGVEAAARGIPVAVSAETHYRGRGFTHDIESRQDLERLLEDPPVMSPDEAELARRYAFLFFFRRMVPFPAVVPEGIGLARVPVEASQIAPGSDPYLDLVCDRILDGGPFHLPPELAMPADGNGGPAPAHKSR